MVLKEREGERWEEGWEVRQCDRGGFCIVTKMGIKRKEIDFEGKGWGGAEEIGKREYRKSGLMVSDE